MKASRNWMLCSCLKSPSLRTRQAWWYQQHHSISSLTPRITGIDQTPQSKNSYYKILAFLWQHYYFITQQKTNNRRGKRTWKLITYKQLAGRIHLGRKKEGEKKEVVTTETGQNWSLSISNRRGFLSHRNNIHVESSSQGGYWKSQQLNHLKRAWPLPQNHDRKTPALTGGKLAIGEGEKEKLFRKENRSVVVADVP